ncbi:hypothetical protein ACT4UT_33535, partial [Bacillus sp. B-TM1]
MNLKQVDHTIKAFYKANVSGKLGILGDGPEILPLKNLVNKLNLQNRVDFLGWSSSPQDFICQSRFVFSGNSIPFGIVTNSDDSKIFLYASS